MDQIYRTNWKRISVSHGPTNDTHFEEAEIPGVLPSERLTPKLAARAARVAFGHRDGVTVTDWEHGIAYRLYKRSARKVKLEQ